MAPKINSSQPLRNGPSNERGGEKSKDRRFIALLSRPVFVARHDDRNCDSGPTQAGGGRPDSCSSCSAEDAAPAEGIVIIADGSGLLPLRLGQLPLTLTAAGGFHVRNKSVQLGLKLGKPKARNHPEK